MRSLETMSNICAGALYKLVKTFIHPKTACELPHIIHEKPGG